MNVASRLEDRTLAARSARMAALVVRRGVTAGSVVALMLPEGPELAIVFYGVLRAGAIAAPVPAALEAEALRERLEQLAARLLVAWHGWAETVETATAASGTAVVFVAPGEFERLLAGVQPDRTVADRRRGDLAVLLPGGTRLTHGDLEGRPEPLAVLA